MQQFSGGASARLTFRNRASNLFRVVVYPWISFGFAIFACFARFAYFCCCKAGVKQHYSKRVVGQERVTDQDLKLAVPPLPEINLAAIAEANTKKTRAGLALQLKLSLDWDLCEFLD